MPLRDMYENCEQCHFIYARVDTEAWGKNSARRIMCPVCGWTAYEEINWDSGEPEVVKRSVAKGYGAFRLIPPGGYCGYNAFHEFPSIELLTTLKRLLSGRGWKGYISVWSDKESKAFLVFGNPLDKFDVLEREEDDACSNEFIKSFSSGNEEAAFTWSRASAGD